MTQPQQHLSEAREGGMGTQDPFSAGEGRYGNEGGRGREHQRSP